MGKTQNINVTYVGTMLHLKILESYEHRQVAALCCVKELFVDICAPKVWPKFAHI